MASAGRGTHLFISQPDNMQKAVMGLFNGAFKVQYTDIEVEWPQHANILQSPYKIPKAEINERIIINALIDSLYFGESIRVYACNKSIQWDVPILHTKGNSLQKFIAHSLVRDLQSGNSFAHAQKQSAEEIKKSIIDICLTYQLASKYTSFVATEEREEATESQLVPVKVDTKGAAAIPTQAEERALKESEEKARREAEEKARKEAEEKARKEAEDFFLSELLSKRQDFGDRKGKKK